MKKRKPLTKAQKDAQERNWLRFRVYGIMSIFTEKNIRLLQSMLPERDHYLVNYLVENLEHLIAALECK
jgi:hypothetical protein